MDFQIVNLLRFIGHRNLRNLALRDDSVVLEMGRVDQVLPDIFKDAMILSPEKLRNRNVQDHMESLNWRDDYFSKQVEKRWRKGPHYMHCAAPGGKKLGGVNIFVFS